MPRNVGATSIGVDAMVGGDLPDGKREVRGMSMKHEGCCVVCAAGMHAGYAGRVGYTMRKGTLDNMYLDTR
jgi:hypothetical protein